MKRLQIPNVNKNRVDFEKKIIIRPRALKFAIDFTK